MEGNGVVLWPDISGPWLGLSSRLAYHSTPLSQLRGLMSIRTISFEYGGLWDESFPGRQMPICLAIHRVWPTCRGPFACQMIA